MEVRYATLDDCHTADGLVVVIDVIRAFTTAAHVLDRGAREIWPVAGIEEAFALRERHPDVLLIGERGGLQVEGFDAGNSPSQLDGVDFSGRTVVQRTSAGTQGIARSVRADVMLAASFVCATATVRAIRALADGRVTFVVTGASAARDGDEDRACADLVAASLTSGRHAAPGPYVDRVVHSDAARQFHDTDKPDFPAEDLDRATELDRFDFALRVERHAGRAVLRPFTVDGRGDAATR
jgi:2-phosphosulfolactate phosphatase